MVRKEIAFADQRIGSIDSGEVQVLVEQWLQRIRSLLPEDGTAVGTVHKISKRRYLVSFRASAYGETFISEVRKEELTVAINEAGSHLFERLGQTPPQPKATFSDKVRWLFGEREAS